MCRGVPGDSLERKSGYYARPWEWEAIRKHVGFIDQFGSTNDPYIPWREMQVRNAVAVAFAGGGTVSLNSTV